MDVKDYRKGSVESLEDTSHYMRLASELVYFAPQVKEVNKPVPVSLIYAMASLFKQCLANWCSQLKKHVPTHVRSNLNSAFNAYNRLDYAETFYSISNQFPLTHDIVNGRFYLMSAVETRQPLIHEVAKLCQGQGSILDYGCGVGIDMVLLHQLAPQIRLSGFEYPYLRYAMTLANLEAANVKAEIFFG